MENIMMLEKSAMYLKPKYIERIPKELKKMHGSKVKLGVFCGCRITMFGTESVILVDKDHLVPLTPSYIKACYQLYEKFKHEQMKKYYYYSNFSGRKLE